MLSEVDRIQTVAADRRAVAGAYQRILGAEVVGEGRADVFRARRTVLRLGRSEVEVLEPDGTGPAADFLSRTGGGLFAAGFATTDVAELAAHLQSHGVLAVEQSGQLFIPPEASGVTGLRAVISGPADRSPAGLVRRLYEVTLLVEQFATVTAKAAEAFGLDSTSFVPIRSEEFGYEGVLTLFHPDRLDRVEIVTPNEPEKTMGRFFKKRGSGPYMCYAESDDLSVVRERLLEHAPKDWTGPQADPRPNNLFIHPKALGGVMLGVSRTTFAWTWSGHPERVQPTEGA